MRRLPEVKKLIYNLFLPKQIWIISSRWRYYGTLSDRSNTGDISDRLFVAETVRYRLQLCLFTVGSELHLLFGLQRWWWNKSLHQWWRRGIESDGLSITAYVWQRLRLRIFDVGSELHLLFVGVRIKIRTKTPVNIQEVASSSVISLIGSILL
jgi:hypothetical protein